METVTLTIDGRQITVEKGKTVLQAAIESGISLPYYCYHPGISIDGSCRVCVVKIEKMPKLQTSCSTLCTDGMVVHTASEDVAAARAGVFEFLLINHPLDCPVCDKGGECPLQDFSYTYGPERSRMEFPRREFDGSGVKADVDFGPTLMLNRNRCILCTRCVRFMRDIDTDAQINIVDRGAGSEIATFQEEGVHSLLSGNLMDICPVGAITTRDYRFKARPWDNPNVVDTICTMCSKGCNTMVWLKAKPEWAKGTRLIRFTPRFNPDVNGYWMCDIGRFDYHWIESERRLTAPLVRDASGQLRSESWHDVMTGIAGRIGTRESRSASDALRFLVSAHASHEELFVLRHLAAGLGSTDLITMTWRVTQKSQPAGTKFPVPAVDAPNVAGGRLLGLIPRAGEQEQPNGAALKAAVAAGQVGALYVFDPGPDGSLGDISWVLEARASGRLPLLIVHGVLRTELAEAADFVLPGASFVEKDASYTNDRGRLQSTSRAIAPPGEALEDWRILADVSLILGHPLEQKSEVELRSALASTVPEFNGIDQMVFGRPVGARHWLQASNPSERWKWDFMYQDVPPTKFGGEPYSTNFESVTPVIPLKEVK